jgi:hypothetical protein
MAKREKLWIKDKISVFCKKDFDFQNQKYIAGNFYNIHKKKDELSYIKGENKISRNDYGYWFTEEDGKPNSFNEYFGDYVTNFTGINKGDMAYCTKTIRHKSATFYKVRAVDISGVNSMIRFNGVYAPFSLTRENTSSLNFGINMPFINDYFVNEIIGKALNRDRQIDSIIKDDEVCICQPFDKMIIRRFNRLILK